jgi:hypothetical protein
MTQARTSITIPVETAKELYRIAGRIQAETGKRVSVADVVDDLLRRAPGKRP